MPGDILTNFTTDLTISDYPLSYPLTVNFTDKSLGAPTAWHWDFGDGNYSNEQNPTHTYELEPEANILLYSWKDSTNFDPGFTVLDGGVRSFLEVSPEIWGELWGDLMDDAFGTATQNQVGKFAEFVSGQLIYTGYNYFTQLGIDLSSQTDAFLTLLVTDPVNNSFFVEGDLLCTVDITEVAEMLITDINGIEKVVLISDLAIKNKDLGPVTGGIIQEFLMTPSLATNGARWELWGCYPFGDDARTGWHGTPQLGGSLQIVSYTSDHWDNVSKDINTKVDFVGVPTTGPSPLAVQFKDLSIISIASEVWDFGDETTTTFAGMTNPLKTYTIT